MAPAVREGTAGMDSLAQTGLNFGAGERLLRIPSARVGVCLILTLPTKCNRKNALCQSRKLGWRRDNATQGIRRRTR